MERESVFGTALVAGECFAEWIAVEGFVGEVFEGICVVDAFAASGGSNVWAMDLFGND